MAEKEAFEAHATEGDSGEESGAEGWELLTGSRWKEAALVYLL